MEAPARFGPRFALVVGSATCYFVGIGLLAPVLPHYVEDVLKGGGVEVGVVVGAFAVSAALLRSTVGRIGDRRGRRVLVVGGCLVAGLSILGYGADGLAMLILLRLVTGAGEAAMFVGAATTAQDLAPAARRGQAASFFSIAVYGGLAIGPPAGEWLYHHHGAAPVWLAGGVLCVLAAAIGTTLPTCVAPPPERTRSRFLHPAAIRPGIVLCLGGLGYAGFSSFVPLYVEHIGVRSAGPVFVEYAAIVLAVRIVGSRIPDVLGAGRGPLVALALQAAGLIAMGLWGSVLGLYASTAVYASGVSLLYPALFPAVVDAAPDAERSHAIGTFTLFFDLSQGLGAPLLGVAVALFDERAAFVAAGVGSAMAWWLHRAARHSYAPGPDPGVSAGTAGTGPAETGPPRWRRRTGRRPLPSSASWTQRSASGASRARSSRPSSTRRSAARRR